MSESKKNNEIMENSGFRRACQWTVTRWRMRRKTLQGCS
jgi:hypothetical protein